MPISKHIVIVKLAFALGFSALSAVAAFAEEVPDALSVEWQGKHPCERLYEDSAVRIARCTFAPGAEHVRHRHPAYLYYVLKGGKGLIRDAKGEREVTFAEGTFSNSPAVPWHEFTNTGDTTVSYLVIEKKYGTPTGDAKGGQ